jgi:hypothetical protein
LNRPPEGTKLAVFDQQKIDDLWSICQPMSKIFSDETRGDKEAFVKGLLDRHTQTLEFPTGLLILKNLKEGLRGEVHITFWDRKLSDKTEMIKDALVWAMMEFDLHRLEAFVPEVSRAVKHFIQKRLGFVYEGRMRKRNWYEGRLIDVLIFSLLREEVL